MAIFLWIDTATPIASVGLFKHGNIIATCINTTQNDYSIFVHVSIQKMMQQHVLPFKDIHAVVVIQGPGSYTGLRIGLAAAKGICFTLQIPLIGLNMLELFAHSFVYNQNRVMPFNTIIISAYKILKPQFVYGGVYDINIHTLQLPNMLVIEDTMFDKWIQQSSSVVCNIYGGVCIENICKQKNIVVLENPTYQPIDIMNIGERKWQKKDFLHIIDAEPIYFG